MRPQTVRVIGSGDFSIGFREYILRALKPFAIGNVRNESNPGSDKAEPKFEIVTLMHYWREP
jgi:hypothetical protein